MSNPPSLKNLSDIEESVQLKKEATVFLFGREVDRNSLLINGVFILFIILFSYILEKYFKIFSNNKFNYIFLIFIVVYLYINIYTASLYSADVVYESQTLIFTQDGITALLSICALMFSFFGNVAPYIRNNDIVFKLLSICMILLSISLYTPNTTQTGDMKRLVRKVKENLFRICVYIFMIIIVYSAFTKDINPKQK